MRTQIVEMILSPNKDNFDMAVAILIGKGHSLSRVIDFVQYIFKYSNAFFSWRVGTEEIDGETFITRKLNRGLWEQLNSNPVYIKDITKTFSLEILKETLESMFTEQKKKETKSLKCFVSSKLFSNFV